MQGAAKKGITVQPGGAGRKAEGWMMREDLNRYDGWGLHLL